MKTLSWVVVGLMLVEATLRAQTYSVIYYFTNSALGTPRAGVVVSGNTIYGTTSSEDRATGGGVFKLNADGTGYFAFNSGVYGANYAEGPILNGNVVYGLVTGQFFTAYTDVTNYFFGANSFPGTTEPVLSGTNLYWINGNAIVGCSTSGNNAFTLRSFSGIHDGSYPEAGMVVAGRTLYGTAYSGGTNGWGTVFKINPDGTGYATLYSFTNTPDGANPAADLIVSGGILYGTTEHGGSAGLGTVFAISTNGTGYTILHSFTGSPDGANPEAGLLRLGNTVYGTTYAGGSAEYGTVFEIGTTGTGYAVLHSFLGYLQGDGAYPLGNLAWGGDVLYGTTSAGGATNYPHGNYSGGTIFALTPAPPPLQTASAVTGPVVFWPFDGFNRTLQTTTNLNSGIWTAVSNRPPLIGLQVTNTATQSQAFFRLQ